MLNPGLQSTQPQSSPKDFTAIDYYNLADYKKERFPTYEPYIAYALVSKTAEGKRVAHQFEFPYVADPRVPKVKRLKEISFGNDGSNNDIHAITSDGEELTTNRSIKLETQNLGQVPANFELLFFSPISTEDKQLSKFWKTEQSNRDEDVSETQPEESEPSVVRGGQLDFGWSDILSRLKASSSPGAQNDVIGHSAQKAYYNYWEANRDKLTPDMQNIIRRSFQNEPSDPFMSPEWCHALARQFHHVDNNPQYVNNLGAAPKWINSKMMVVESAARWYAKTYPEAKINLVSHFKMLGKSDVVKNGHMEATIEHGEKRIKIAQELKPHQRVPVYSQATDRAITTFIVDSLLHAKTPSLIPSNDYSSIVDGLENAPMAMASSTTEQPYAMPFKFTLDNRLDTVFAAKAASFSQDNPFLQQRLENLRECQHMMLNTLSSLLQEVSRGQYENFRAWLLHNKCTYLDLSYDKARNINLYHLGQALRGTQVTTIDLSNNLINEENGLYFGKMMQGTPISTVILKDRSSAFTMDRRRISRINAGGAAALARGLKRSQVKIVDLTGNQIGHQGAIDFIRELRDAPVNSLCLLNNNVNLAEMNPLVSCIDGTSLENIELEAEHPALQEALLKNKDRIQRLIQKMQEAKPVKYKSRLFVGESDFSFTTAFLEKHKDKKGLTSQVTATALESREDVWRKYGKTFPSFQQYQASLRSAKEDECEVYYNVDAKALDKNQCLTGKRFQRIHYNLPNDGSSYDEPSLTLMLLEFFENARKLQKDGDRIHMALPTSADAKTRHFIEGYAYSLHVITASAGYKLIKKRHFGHQRYPGYQPVSLEDTNTPLCEYIFEKTNLSYTEIFEVTPPHYVPSHLPGKRAGHELMCLTPMDMEEDSSNCEDDEPAVERNRPLEPEPKRDSSGIKISLRNLHSHRVDGKNYGEPKYFEEYPEEYSESYDEYSNYEQYSSSSDPDQERSSRRRKKRNRK